MSVSLVRSNLSFCEIVDEIQQIAISVWNYAVTWIQNSCTTASFVFFRTMEWLAPSLAQKLEVGYLYALNFMNGYLEERRAVDFERNIAQLQRGQQGLQQAYDRLVDEKNALHATNGRLTGENDLLRLELDHLNGNYGRLENRFNLLQEENEHLKRDRDQNQRLLDLVREEIDPLQIQTRELLKERNALRAEIQELRQLRVQQNQNALVNLPAAMQVLQKYATLPQQTAVARLLGDPR